MKIEQKINELGLMLPDCPKPVAVYVSAKRVGNIIYVSGQIPQKDGEILYKGKVGEESIDEGRKAAQICVLNCLAAIKSLIGDLDKIDQIVKVVGFVNSAPGFTNQPKVINSASELIAKLFGENGNHSRSAVGVSELPLNISVEIEMIVSIKCDT